MSEYFDSDDPFADLTADDLDNLESAAINATQHPLPPPLPPHHHHHHQYSPQPLPQNDFPSLDQDIPMDDSCGQFNVDDEDLFLAPTTPPPPPPPHLSPSHSSHPHSSTLLAELTALRAETARLKLERDALETAKFTQDGKLEHLQRTLSKTRLDHDYALTRIKQSLETEKRNLQSTIADRERKLASLSAEIEFQKNEIREARMLAQRGTGGTVKMAGGGVGETGSPSKRQGAARVVTGSGVKSPEAKARIGIFSSRAFGREEIVVGKKDGNRKRKREEPRGEVVEVQPQQIVGRQETGVGAVSEEEINRIVMDKVLRERASWTNEDERFEVDILYLLGFMLMIVDEGCAISSDGW